MYLKIIEVVCLEQLIIIIIVIIFIIGVWYIRLL